MTLDAGTDERLTLDGQPRPFAELAEALTQKLKSQPATIVLLRVAESVPFERVRRTVKAIEDAGITSIRLAPTTDKSD